MRWIWLKVLNLTALTVRDCGVFPRFPGRKANGDGYVRMHWCRSPLKSEALSFVHSVSSTLRAHPRFLTKPLCILMAQIYIFGFFRGLNESSVR